MHTSLHTWKCTDGIDIPCNFHCQVRSALIILHCGFKSLCCHHSKSDKRTYKLNSFHIQSGDNNNLIKHKCPSLSEILMKIIRSRSFVFHCVETQVREATGVI